MPNENRAARSVPPLLTSLSWHPRPEVLRSPVPSPRRGCHGRFGHRECIGREGSTGRSRPRSRAGPQDDGPATSREDRAMLDGVVVDDLTGHFLAVATDGDRSRDLSQALRVFFHDARNTLNSLKIGLYVARRGAAGTASTWDELDQSYRGLEQLVDRLQTICRPVELAAITGDLGPWLEEESAFLVVAAGLDRPPARLVAAPDAGGRTVRPEATDPGPRRPRRLAVRRGGGRRAGAADVGRRCRGASSSNGRRTAPPPPSRWKAATVARSRWHCPCWPTS